MDVHFVDIVVASSACREWDYASVGTAGFALNLVPNLNRHVH